MIDNESKMVWAGLFLPLIVVFVLIFAIEEAKPPRPEKPGNVTVRLREMDRAELHKEIEANCDWNGAVWLYKPGRKESLAGVTCEFANRRGIPGGK